MQWGGGTLLNKEEESSDTPLVLRHGSNNALNLYEPENVYSLVEFDGYLRLQSPGMIVDCSAGIPEVVINNVNDKVIRHSIIIHNAFKRYKSTRNSCLLSRFLATCKGINWDKV